MLHKPFSSNGSYMFCLKRLFIVATVLLIGGCAATGARFSPEPAVGNGKALVYVYRPSIAVNCCVAPYIFINSQKQGQLKNGGYLVVAVDPGPLTVEAVNETVGFKSLKLTVNAMPGQSYYFRWAAAAAMGMDPAPAKPNEAKELRLNPNNSSFASAEARKRADEKARGTLDGVQRDTDTDTQSPLRSGAFASLFTTEHERELRAVAGEVALKEIVLTNRVN
jgi:hypothetical protein